MKVYDDPSVSDGYDGVMWLYKKGLSDGEDGAYDGRNVSDGCHII
jgi:hypothetical protein